jgi:hypothetical protein
MSECDCNHLWVSNSGRGGEPDFRPNRQMSTRPLMHVRCSRCGVRTWFTPEQWRALDPAPQDDRHG